MANTYMVRGDEYLSKHPGFNLIGRDEDLAKLSSILVRRKANSVLLVGPGGVGCTALLMGLQAMKRRPDAPFDIVSKRMFWLDTDGLFSSGDHEEIDNAFKRDMNVLARTPDSILIIEDTRDFIEAARNSGNTHFVNALTQAVKNDKTQVIFECRDEDLEFVIKWHSDIRESYTLMDVTEPVGDVLLAIVRGIADDLTKHHGIRIADDALQAAVELTTKYRTEDHGLSRAQPERAISLLDRALSSYRLNAHNVPPRIAALEARYKAEPDNRATIEAELRPLARDWNAKQEEIKRLYQLQRQGEIAVMDAEDDLARQLETEQNRVEDAVEAKPSRLNAFAAMSSRTGIESEAVTAIRGKIKRLQDGVAQNKDAFEEITNEINASLELTRGFVVQEFSRVSGISANKLNEDERVILRNLDATLKRRVFGQDAALEKVANAVKIGRVGRRNRDKPVGSFLFMGPSGVGKTEAAKALAQALLGDEKALTRFDMSEYMEKHAVAKMIGAPPGYEGFEAGGILTNAMRRNRNRVLLFDEIEKAHPDVFNIFLQILSDGRLTDNVGREVFFDEAIIVMTTNIGQPHFLNKDLSVEQAEELAMVDLEAHYRPEFLNRFAGRQNIMCFSRLGLPSIEKIVRRELADLDAAYSGSGLHSVVLDEDVRAFCEDHYDPKMGARGLPGYIQVHLEPIIANRVLDAPDTHGVFNIVYDHAVKSFDVKFKEQLAA